MHVRMCVRACHHTCVRVRARVFVRISVLGLQTVADAVGELLLLAPQHRLGQERALRRVKRLPPKPNGFRGHSQRTFCFTVHATPYWAGYSRSGSLRHGHGGLATNGNGQWQRVHGWHSALRTMNFSTDPRLRSSSRTTHILCTGSSPITCRAHTWHAAWFTGAACRNLHATHAVCFACGAL